MTNAPGPGLARRKYPRRIFSRIVSLLHKGSYSTGKGREIGEGGMLVVSDSDFSQGDLVLVNFLLPAAGICIVQAEIRSIRLEDGTKHFGLLFLNLNYEGKKGIREFIAAKSEEESQKEKEILTRTS